MSEAHTHARNSDPPFNHRRHSDAFIARWTRRIWPLVVLVIGFMWREAASAYKLIPTPEKSAELQRYMDERPKLVLEFRLLQGEVTVLKQALAEDRNLSTEQRQEILGRLQRLEEKMDRWFERTNRVISNSR